MKVELLAITPNSEELIETAGRTCYQSQKRDEHRNRKNFIEGLMKNGHYSVVEHAYATFRISGVSRSATHQLVRHRLCAFSQQSQRYVNEEDFNYVEPESIANNPDAHAIFAEFIGAARRSYKKLQQLGINKQDARFVLPNACESEIILSSNFRELRHIFYLRCNKHAQWEIRNIALDMLGIMKEYVPSVFADFVVDKISGTANTPFVC